MRTDIARGWTGRWVHQGVWTLGLPLSSLNYPGNPEETTVIGRCPRSDVTEPAGTGMKDRAALFARQLRGSEPTSFAVSGGLTTLQSYPQDYLLYRRRAASFPLRYRECWGMGY